LVPQVVFQEIEKIVYVDRPIPVVEIKEVIKIVEVQVPEIIIQEREKIKLVEVPTKDTIELIKKVEVDKYVPLIETVIKPVDRIKYIDKPVILIDKVEVPVPFEKIREIEKMVTVVDKQEVLKPVDVLIHVDRVQYLENHSEIIREVDRPSLVKEKETLIKEVYVETPYRVPEYREVK
jgi:hypothetical protein